MNEEHGTNNGSVGKTRAQRRREDAVERKKAGKAAVKRNERKMRKQRKKK